MLRFKKIEKSDGSGDIDENHIFLKPVLLGPSVIRVLSSLFNGCRESRTLNQHALMPIEAINNLVSLNRSLPKEVDPRLVLRWERKLRASPSGGSLDRVLGEPLVRQWGFLLAEGMDISLVLASDTLSAHPYLQPTHFLAVASFLSLTRLAD